MSDIDKSVYQPASYFRERHEAKFRAGVSSISTDPKEL